MCGIIFALNKKKKPVNQLIINQYEDQFSRGQRGFGIIRINQESIEIDRATEPYKFLIDLYQKESSAIIAHHRTPTSTENKMSQTHPIIVSNEKLSFDYLFVHNGIIYNAEEIKKEHEAFGFKYKTELKKEEKEESSYSSYYQKGNFNDSESMAIEMALFIEKKIKEIRTRGSQAFIALQIEKKTQKPVQLFFGREDNPLNMFKDKELLFLSSEGKGKAIKESVIFSFKINDKKIKFTERKMIFKKEKEEKEETKPFLSAWQKDHQEKTEKIDISNNKEKTKEIIYDEYEEYFKDSIKNRSTEEIEEISEEALEYLELEIMEIVSDLRTQLFTARGNKKTGEFKGRICSTLDEIKKVIIATQAEMAIAETRDVKETAQEFIDWRKENNCPSRGEILGQQSLTRFGF